MSQFEELDAPVAEVVLVKGRVALPADSGPAAGSGSEDHPGDRTPSMIRPSWVVATAVGACLLALVIGDDGPWILVIPVITALIGTWLDQRIPFSFAEGFIGYGGDPEPAHGVPEDDWPPASKRGAAAAA